MLCIHQCAAPRAWQGTEIEFVSQIATQLGVALQQAELLERSRQQALELATINSNLEQEIIVRRQAEQRLSLFIQQTPLAVIEWDTNFRVTRWNPAACQMFGYTATEAMGRHPAQLVLPEEVWESVDENFTMLLTQNEGSRSTTENLTKDGRLIVCEWYNTPLIDAGEVIGIASLVLDITERVQAEAQLRQKTEQLQNALQELQHTQTHLIQSEKMSSLGQLVAGVAHEINNPVNFIYGNIAHVDEYTQDLLGLLELYQSYYPEAIAEIDAKIEDADLEFIGEDLPKLLTSMRVGAERIREIVLSLRNFSRLDQAEVKPVDIHEGLDSTLMILQHRLKPTASRPGIDVVKEFGDLPEVECFAGQLNQVFMNLLANAIDALQEYQDSHGKVMPNQQPARITISTCGLDAETVQIGIKDNGPGIPEEVRDRLFDPFFTTKPAGKGTGLGLSISYQIVEKHQGTLRCRSTEDGGAEFVIKIPVKQAISAKADSLLLDNPAT
ncbi:MAG TPA: PAS domain S-box protein [Leptolyngbyaceae cyanobacterium M33_DOE_097]|uniref:histidine kinase n=1 Tax=Oscillatoriales cyanobacterium SpSt-418 TaxID=2282169 RepID=A0A7C3PEL3_9CYAN|nr:PAS domain S-box protein [Leptolyngbyaceae cyanobacterium M33_DOE_097]